MFTHIWGRFPIWLIFFKGVWNHQQDTHCVEQPLKSYLPNRKVVFPTHHFSGAMFNFQGCTPESTQSFRSFSWFPTPTPTKTTRLPKPLQRHPVLPRHPVKTPVTSSLPEVIRREKVGRYLQRDVEWSIQTKWLSLCHFLVGFYIITH